MPKYHDPDYSRRLGRALASPYFETPAGRPQYFKLQAAAASANSWQELPAWARALVERVEGQNKEDQDSE